LGTHKISLRICLETNFENCTTFHLQNSLARTAMKAPKSCHITPILRSLHWLRITERIEYKLLSLTYKVLTTTQPPYPHNLIYVQRPRSYRSSSVVTLARPPSSSSLKITDLSFRYASPCLWNQLPLSLCKPHSGTSSSFPTHLFLHPSVLPSDSPLCTSITPSVFHSQLKTYLFHKSYPPIVSLLPSGLPPRTFACTVSSELYGF